MPESIQWYVCRPQVDWETVPHTRTMNREATMSVVGPRAWGDELNSVGGSQVTMTSIRWWHAVCSHADKVVRGREDTCRWWLLFCTWSVVRPVASVNCTELVWWARVFWYQSQDTQRNSVVWTPPGIYPSRGGGKCFLGLTFSFDRTYFFPTWEIWSRKLRLSTVGEFLLTT